jgi:hypothetical protein
MPESVVEVDAKNIAIAFKIVQKIYRKEKKLFW